MKKEIDLAQKLANALMHLKSVPRTGPEIRVFMVIDQASPYELSVEDLEAITHLDRNTIGPAISTLVKWGYIQEKGGLVSRQR